VGRGGSLDKHHGGSQQHLGGPQLSSSGGHGGGGFDAFGGGHGGSGHFEPIQRGTFINPFRPEEFIVRITANRRRWIHVFPVDRLGRKLLYFWNRNASKNPKMCKISKNATKSMDFSEIFLKILVLHIKSGLARCPDIYFSNIMNNDGHLFGHNRKHGHNAET
jgi:hypothetical protein